MIAPKDRPLGSAGDVETSLREFFRSEIAVNLAGLAEELGIDVDVVASHLESMARMGVVEVINPVGYEPARQAEAHYHVLDTYFRWMRPTHWQTVGHVQQLEPAMKTPRRRQHWRSTEEFEG